MAPAATLYSRGHQPREGDIRAIRPLVGGLLCLDYVNTTSDHAGRPLQDDLAPGYVNLVDWCRQAGVLDENDTRRLLRAASKEPREAAAVRKRALALREALDELVLALGTGRDPSPEALDTFNREHQQALAHGRFVPDAASLRWQWADGSHLDRPLWPVCQSAADLLTSEGLGKVRQCAALACQNLFLDGSKNGSRRYCSAATCGTADRVRRFRERQASTH